MEYTFITYEEASRLKPFFREAKKSAPYREARESAGRISEELGRVRNVDSSPFRGHQLVLSGVDMRFLRDTMDVLDLGE